MGFAYTNKKGRTYYLHQKGALYYFAAEPKESIDLPEGKIVIEHPTTGLPMVKNKEGKK